MDAHEAAVNAAEAELSAYQFNLVSEAYAKLQAAWEERAGGGGGGGGPGLLQEPTAAAGAGA
jgi:hypothetical protein